MIEKLILRNFQKHERFVLELDERLTVVTGKTESGKSSIIRGFRWLAFNRPGGDAFIRHGQSRAKVNALVDGRSIQRDKGDGRNEYRLDGHTFKAFGNDVPDQIGNLLNLGPDNFASQHAPHFWFSLSPGDVAKEFNRIVNLELIDRVLANGNRECRDAKAKVDFVRERLVQARADRSALAWVVDADTELKFIEEEYNNVIRDREKCTRIADVVERVNRATQERNNAVATLKLGEEALAAAEQWKEAAERFDRADKALTRYEMALNERDAAQMELMELEAELTKVKNCPVCGGPMKGK